MKRYLSFLLALLLLLSGCSSKQEQAAVATEPEDAGLYDPDHPVQAQTAGAVRAYPLGETNNIGILLIGSKLLLIRENGTGRVLQGENCQIAAEGTVGITAMSDAIFDADTQGIAVFDRQTGEVVRLNPQLQEVERLALPKDIQGDPTICLETNEVFYCQNGEIRALDMQSGIARLIKSHVSVNNLTMIGSYFNGTVICCRTENEAGESSVMYLAADSGLTLNRDVGIYQFETLDQQYFIRRTDNTVEQIVVGTKNGEAHSLTVPTENTRCIGALQMNGVVTYTTTETGLEMDFHDLTQEKTTAKLSLPGVGEPVGVVADGNYVWMVVGEESQQVLYRWDVTLSGLQEQVPVIAPLHTAEAPDEEGIALCRQRADQIDATHGVSIRIWQDAAKDTENHLVVPEYQPQVINSMMDQLESAMQRFPENFLKDSIRSGSFRIGLVRSIASGDPWVQYWNGGDCCILISSQTDVAQAFMEAVGYGIDSRVLGNSRDYDTWNKLNPTGFQYGKVPTDDDGNVRYLEGEDRAFVNESAMTSPTEDRRQLFVAAIAQDNGEVFAPKPMQAKLRRMCEGIREAYGLEKEQVVYFWEQYLTEPMVKKNG